MNEQEFVEQEQNIREAVEAYREMCDKNQLDFEERMADIVFEILQD